MRRLILLACTAAIGSGIFWMFYDSSTPGRSKTSLVSPFIEKRDEISSIKKEEKIAKKELAKTPEHRSIKSIPPQALYTGPIELPVPEKGLEIKEQLQVWATKPHFREVKNIVPPIKGVHPPASATLVTEEVINNGGILDLGFKAYLHLPADALVDEWGNPINEPVKISYCPLSDPVDVYLSGVPMTYDTAGNPETFRTAGMVRLEAETWSGKKVSLKKGETMRLDMPTVATSDDYNFYTFNEDKGAWSYEKPAPQARPVIDFVIDTLDIKFNFDVTPFSEKFTNMDYHYLTNTQVKREKYMLKSGRIITSAMEKSMREALYYSRFSSINLIKLNPSNPIVGYTDDHKAIREVQFKLSFAGKGSFYFRELRHFAGYSFVAEDVKSLQDFYKHYRRGRKFHDIRIDYENGSDYCTFILKDEKEMVQLKARISRGVRAGFTDISKMRFMFAHLRYSRDLKIKEAVHDEVVQKEKRKIVERMFGRRGQMLTSNGSQYRQLSIPGFATFNCDQIARMVDPQLLPKRFVKEDRTKISPDVVVVCDARVRATFNFYKSYKIDPACSEGGLAFILVNSGDKTYYMSGKEVQKKINEAELELKELPEIESGDQLKKLLLGT